MNIQHEIIYHIVTASDFRKNVIGFMYVPESLLREGFIHCTFGRNTTLLVMEDFFGDVSGTIYLLKIVTNAVIAPVRFEDAASSSHSGKKHLEVETVFPHIYGPLILDAVEGLGVIGRSGDKFLWPETFSAYLPDFY
jgi:uncharacterized protein (DUF952 family)